MGFLTKWGEGNRTPVTGLEGCCGCCYFNVHSENGPLSALSGANGNIRLSERRFRRSGAGAA
jgi:hypothetical protein